MKYWCIINVLGGVSVLVLFFSDFNELKGVQLLSAAIYLSTGIFCWYNNIKK